LFTTEEADLDRQNGAGIRGPKELRGGHPQQEKGPCLVRDLKDRFKQGEQGSQLISWWRGRHVSPVTIVYTGTLARNYTNYSVHYIYLPHSHLAPSPFPHPSFSPHSATVLWTSM